MSPLVIGLTVVAFGISAQELAVSVQSAISGSAGCSPPLALNGRVGHGAGGLLLGSLIAKRASERCAVPDRASLCCP